MGRGNISNVFYYIGRGNYYPMILNSISVHLLINWNKKSFGCSNISVIKSQTENMCSAQNYGVKHPPDEIFEIFPVASKEVINLK